MTLRYTESYRILRYTTAASTVHSDWYTDTVITCARLTTSAISLTLKRRDYDDPPAAPPIGAQCNHLVKETLNDLQIASSRSHWP